MKRLLSVFVLFVSFCVTLGAAHRLENKSIHLGPADQPAITYAELLKAVAGAPVQGGLTADAMRKRLRVIDACEAAKDAPAVVLEDADFDFIVPVVEQFPWNAGATAAIVKFTDDLKAAPKVEPEKK